LAEKIYEGQFGKMKVTNPIHFRFVGYTFILCLFLTFAGCKDSPTTYTLTGRVISKQPASQQLIIDNDDIPGFMSAMTMPYKVKDPEGFQKVQPADVIRAEVIVGQPGEFWLEHLAVIGKAAKQPQVEGAPQQVLMVGDQVPDVALLNQDGKTLHFGQFKGKVVLLTFIYTRCPFPDFCPLLSTKFAAIQKELAKNPDDYKKTHLISISLDPKFDLPPVLRAYGLPYLDHNPKGFDHWDFVSTTPADLLKLTGSFGLAYSEENSQINHSLNTVLLAADGTVADMWPGNEWQTTEVLDVMRHALTLAK
jgi:protein SCO1/2